MYILHIVRWEITHIQSGSGGRKATYMYVFSMKKLTNLKKYDPGRKSDNNKVQKKYNIYRLHINFDVV